MKERLQKLMAQGGVGSRRACEELIRQGRVRVNGTVASLGAKADPASDRIVVDNETLRLRSSRPVYIALNKPLNVISSTARHKKDERRTVRDLVRHPGHLFLIGRLDADSQGLVVLTNDGELTHRLTHPRFQHTRSYRATLYGLPDAAAIRKWERGLWLPEEARRTAPCVVRVVRNSQGLAIVEIVMAEGRKRQIRRIANALGHPVRHLTRTHIGRLGLGELRPGEWRALDEQDLTLLKTADSALKRNLEPRPARNRPGPLRPARSRPGSARSGRPSRPGRPFRRPTGRRPRR